MTSRLLPSLILATLLPLATPAFAQTSDVESRADALAARGDFAEGATLLESIPDDASERTQRALHRAMTWRVALGDEPAATRVAARLSGADGAMRALEVGALYEQRRAWRSSLRFHREWLTRAAGVVSPEQSAVGRVALARAYRALHDDASAMREYRAVAAMAPRQATRASCVEPVTEAERAYDDAVAEATYRVVEHEARPLLTMRAPPAPTRSDAAWLRYMREQFWPWFHRTRQEIRPVFDGVTSTGIGCASRWQALTVAQAAAVSIRFLSAYEAVPERPTLVANPQLAFIRCELADCWAPPGVFLRDTAVVSVRVGLEAVPRTHADRRVTRWFEEQRAQMDGRLTSDELWSESFVSGRVRFAGAALDPPDVAAPPTLVRLPAASVPIDAGFPTTVQR